jgi:cell division protein FtsL
MENSLEKTVKRLETTNKILIVAVIVLAVLIVLLIYAATACKRQ